MRALSSSVLSLIVSSLMACSSKGSTVDLTDSSAGSGSSGNPSGSGSDDAVATTSGISVAELRRGNSQGADPFASQLAMNVKPVTPISTAGVPSTQPATREPFSAPSSKLREIRIIRGGVESTVTVEEPVEPVTSKWMTDAGSDELISGEAAE